jgi:hypothetical protein
MSRERHEFHGESLSARKSPFSNDRSRQGTEARQGQWVARRNAKCVGVPSEARHAAVGQQRETEIASLRLVRGTRNLAQARLIGELAPNPKCAASTSVCF